MVGYTENYRSVSFHIRFTRQIWRPFVESKGLPNDSTFILKAKSDKFDIKRPGILFISLQVGFHFKLAQWLSGRVLDWRPKGGGYEPHRRHCVVS